MGYRHFAGALLATSAIWAGLGTTAAAQEIGEVIVTARRVEERLQDVPISIAVFNQEQLSKQNILSVSDLVKFTPSLSSNTRFGHEKAAYSIRGFVHENNTSPSVGVYFADVIAPRAQALLTAGNGGGPGTMFDLDSVQVLKGPQGTLFGRNTTGGAILLVPRKPTGEFGGYVEGSTGNHDLVRLQGVVNLPLTEQAQLRVGVDRMLRKGWQNNMGPAGPKHFSDIDYVAFRAGLQLELTPDLENYTVGYFSNSDTYGTRNQIFVCQPDPRRRTGAGVYQAPAACDQLARGVARGDGFYDSENAYPHPRSIDRTYQIINTTTWRATDNLTVKNIASYGVYKNLYQGTISGENFIVPATFDVVTNGQVVTRSTGTAAGTPFAFLASQPIRPGMWTVAQKTFTEEFQLQGQTERLTWQAGAYGEFSNPMGDTNTSSTTLLSCTDPLNFVCTDVLSLLAGGTALGSVSVRTASNWFRNYGLYSQATYKLTDKLSVTGGFRYTWDRHKVRSGALGYQFAPARGIAPGSPRTFCLNTVRIPGPRLTNDVNQCLVRFKANSDAPTYTIDLEYKPTDNSMLFAKYSRGYRQGLAYPFAYGFEILEPEKVDTYEIGAKTDFGGIVPGYFNIVAFYNELTNQQISASATPRLGSGVSTSQTVLNLGESEIKGFEIDSVIQPFKPLTIRIAYTYLDTELKTLRLPDLTGNPLFTAVVPNAAIGSSLPMAPKNKWSLGATYTLPLSDDVGDLSFGFNFTHTDKQVASAASPFGIVQATDLLDLNATWKSVFGRPIDLMLFATNVTNEKYWAFISSAYNSQGYENGVPGEPRMYGVRVRYNFGQ